MLNVNPKIRAFVSGFGLTLFVVGLIGVGWYFWQKHQVTQPVVIIPTETITQSTDRPSEAAVSPSDFVNVPADQPREIQLPTINSSGFIQKVGLDQNNAVAVPSNIHIAGWFINSVKPGDEGLSIIDGHVAGWYADGIFKKIGSLKTGDEFTVTYGDNSMRNFKVVEVKTISVEEASNYLFQKDSQIISQLNLITCGGRFDRDTNQYDSRVIVKSELLQI